MSNLNTAAETVVLSHAEQGRKSRSKVNTTVPVGEGQVEQEGPNMVELNYTMVVVEHGWTKNVMSLLNSNVAVGEGQAD